AYLYPSVITALFRLEQNHPNFYQRYQLLSWVGVVRQKPNKRILTRLVKNGNAEFDYIHILLQKNNPF
ncbi:MAG: hypothetical protein LBI27_06185, partial [Clostridiales bacterium]|nr:hypothetical protein [Clostridiales bacterium]